MSLLLPIFKREAYAHRENKDMEHDVSEGINQAEDNKDRDKKKKSEPGIHNDHPIFSKFSNKQYRFSFWYFLALLVILSLFNTYFSSDRTQQQVEYNRFKEMIETGEIARVEITDERYLGYPLTRGEIVSQQQPLGGQSAPMSVYTTYRIDDPAFIPLLDENNVEYYAAPPETPGLLSTVLGWVLPFVFMIVLWQFFFTRMNKGGGQGVMSFNQNKAKIVAEGDTNTRFSDVAGADESKQELEEVVDFLKTPEKYTAVGGKIPKGVLLVGPPGTGKTLLAKAVAGEAGVPFFRMSGADFVEMFVGVGAARVRDLFRQAREKSPCIIFIDEIDAIGRSRAGNIGGNDEREQTLNQLLVEMDGFDAKTGVILLAATNRPEILDPALLRPGRFDRQVLVDKPDLEGRLAILKIHSRDVKVAEDTDLRIVAQSTAGLSGADLANIVNEAALLAVRNGRKQVTGKDFMEAIEKSIAGLERKGRIMNKAERERVAYHETGHALAAYYTEGADQVIKISIVPRGIGALGYTLQQPTEDRYLLSESELLKSIDVLLAGRAAEQIIFGEISTGAANDISRASDLVRRMITEYGMSTNFKNITLPTGQTNTMLGSGFGGQREFSEATQQYIDTETARIVNQQYEKILDLLTQKRPILEKITRNLLKIETVDGDLFKKLIEESEHET
jgi:cell division protease FtsH